MFNTEELKSFAEELRKVGKNYGVPDEVMNSAISKITFKNMSDEEYLDVVNDIVFDLMDHSIPSNLTETIVAEAIHNRERVVTQVVTPKQVVYGPQPRPEQVVVVHDNPKQVVYGPPPVQEQVEVVYNPPKVYGPAPTTGGMGSR